MTRKLDVTITYLEQTERPAPAAIGLPPVKVAILRAENPPVHFYRYLYELIGDPYFWVSRRNLDDENLHEIISDESVYVYVLYAGGVPAGMAELDARKKNLVEIKFFGLAPEFIGRGLGRYFLRQTIDLAWSLNPERVRLETCTLDHPRALPLYQRFGFSVFDQRRGQVEINEDLMRGKTE